MLIKNYLVIDHSLPDPDTVRGSLLDLPFHTNENFTVPGMKNINEKTIRRNPRPRGGWRGFRTTNLLNIPQLDIQNALRPAFKTVFDCSFDISMQVFGHLSTFYLDSIMSSETKWHTDKGSYLAGVIYLNHNPPKKTGTLLKLDTGIVEIENVYNRLVIYKANIFHSPGELFGETLNDSRLTLTFFLNDLKLF